MFWFTGLLFLCTISLTSQASPKKGLLFGSSSSDYIGFSWSNSNVYYQSCLCMWVKNIAPAGSHPTPWSYYYSSGSTYTIVDSKGYHSKFMDDTSLNGRLTSQFGSIPKGRWFHACYNWKHNRNIQVYLNGTLVATSTGSTGETRGSSGKVMIGNRAWSQSTSYAFGGELTNLNMFSKELSAEDIKKQYEGGPCFIDSTLESYRILTWETILGKSRTGVVKDTYIDCQLYEDLNTTSSQLNSTSTKLNTTAAKLETTSALLNTTQENYENATAELSEAKTQLKFYNENYENTTALKTQLVATQKLLNYTKCHSRLDECTAALENATRTLSIEPIPPTHWDILLQDDYLDHVLTEERLDALKSEWDYLDNFLGVNMTEKIIHHLKHYHGHDKNEDHEGWDVLEDFIGVTMSEKVIQHLRDRHKISEEDLAVLLGDDSERGTESENETE